MTFLNSQKFHRLPRITNIFESLAFAVDHLVCVKLYVLHSEVSLARIHELNGRNSRTPSQGPRLPSEKCSQERGRERRADEQTDEVINIIRIIGNYRVFLINQTIARKLVQDLSIVVSRRPRYLIPYFSLLHFSS